MSLYDKFEIIENHLNITEQQAQSSIDNYIENLLNSDIRVFMTDYMNQTVWFKKIDTELLIHSIEQYFKTYLIQRRNQMRVFIKKDSFEMGYLNKFIDNFIKKVEFINDVLKIENNKIVEVGISQLSNLVISDSIIIMFIEESIIAFSTNTDIINLFNVIKKTSKYDNSETISTLLKTFGNIYKKQLINTSSIPLPDNISRIHRLNESIQYYKQITEFYSFIDKRDIHTNLICFPIIQLIFEYLVSILKYNTVYEIEYVLGIVSKDIIKIMSKDFDNKEQIIRSISDEVVLLIDRVSQVETSISKTEFLPQRAKPFDETCKYTMIINIISYTDSIIKTNVYKDVISQKLVTILRSEKNMSNIHSDIDELIRNQQIDSVIKIINIVSNIKDKDIFINKHYQFLINRLLEKISPITPKDIVEMKFEQDFNKFIECEKNVLNVLSKKFGDKLVYKIAKVITDAECSFQDNLNFSKLIDNNILTTVTTSYGNWDINQSEGLISQDTVETFSKDSIIGKYLRNYQKYYGLRYANKRKLCWYPHFGEVDITYLDKNIKLLPIQFLVLELFNDSSIVSIDIVKNQSFFKNYTPKFKTDVIGSLITSKLLYFKNNNLILTTTSDFKENPIDIFFTISDYADIWEQKRTNELIHTREEITKTNINQCIKTNKLDLDNLYKTVKSSIEVFDLERHIFDKSIDDMIKMDYIDVVEGIVQKIYY